VPCALLSDQFLQHHFALKIDFEILFGSEPIFFGGAILRHHDDWRLQGSGHRQHQVKENVRIRIELRSILSMSIMKQNKSIESHPTHQESQIDNDESPRATKRSDFIGDALTYRGTLLHLDVDVARRAL